MKDITINHSRQHDQQVIDLLNDTRYGTNGPVIQHKHVETKLPLIPDPVFFKAYHLDKLVGNVLFSLRTSEKHDCKTAYIRYFSVKPSHANAGIGTALNTYAEDYLSKTEPDLKIVYAYIESSNMRSMRVSDKFVLQKYRKFSTISMSRFSPQQSSFVELLQPQDFGAVAHQVKHFYKDHSFFFDTNLFNIGKFYIIKNKEGKIIAGLRANKITWCINSLPGFSGFIIQKLVPYIPYINRIVNPEDFRFLAFDNIFFQEEGIPFLNHLFESVMAAMQYNMAMMSLDIDSYEYKTVKKYVNLGFISKIEKEHVANLVAHVFEESYKSSLAANPIYINMHDMT